MTSALSVVPGDKEEKKKKRRTATAAPVLSRAKTPSGEGETEGWRRAAAR